MCCKNVRKFSRKKDKDKVLNLSKVDEDRMDVWRKSVVATMIAGKLTRGEDFQGQVKNSVVVEKSAVRVIPLLQGIQYCSQQVLDASLDSY